ncbi:hypothetical protein [Gloeomargarita lithophora]|uniref:hypothetical protein n=1 Tax=Gloeomargarita lithophora TaxID=1188228 RepID=UPI0012FE540E|nr:hypothetical protein [Gloeomargarita lithophora]
MQTFSERRLKGLKENAENQLYQFAGSYAEAQLESKIDEYKDKVLSEQLKVLRNNFSEDKQEIL